MNLFKKTANEVHERAADWTQPPLKRHGPSQRPLRPPLTDPTPREIEILELVAQGLHNREIGEHLWISEETVKSHVRHLLAKMQARNRAHLVARGFLEGLLTTGSQGTSNNPSA